MRSRIIFHNIPLSDCYVRVELVIILRGFLFSVPLLLLLFKEFENMARKFIFFAAVGIPKHTDLSNLNIL